MPRLPTDAFERFVAMGDGRSYSKLAAALGVSKRSVTSRAKAERWQERLASIVSAARAKTEQKLVDATTELNDRHVRTLRAVQAKGLQALMSAPTGTASQAAAAVIASVRAERAILAPPGTEQPDERRMTHAEICGLAAELPEVLVEIAAAWRELDAAARATLAAKLRAVWPKIEHEDDAEMAARTAPPAEPPALLPRVGEN